MKVSAIIGTISYMIALLFLHSCGTQKPTSDDYDEVAWQLDHNQCVSEGFVEDSYEYRDCRNVLMKQRRKNLE